MAMVFHRLETPGIAQIAYLVGDTSTGTAAVVDPTPDVEPHLRLARAHGLAITHVFETHVHADFMSGARELVARLGRAELCASGEGGARYGFEVRKVCDGERFTFGSVRLTARHTPGHTPEHLAYELSEPPSHRPWAVMTGDSLFVGSAGRPDLLGDAHTETLIGELFETLHGYYLELDDGVIVYPGHGAGSACGAAIGSRPMSTIGHERATNPFLEPAARETFAARVRDGAPPEPRHYRYLKRLNADGPPVRLGRPSTPPLTPHAFLAALDRRGAQLLDSRQMLAFGGGHIPGAINIGARPELPVWAGQMLDHERPILLVLDEDAALEGVLEQLALTGFVDIAGYLAGGMRAWEDEGLPLERLRQESVHELKDHLGDVQLLDVRSPGEWSDGHIPGARHLYVADMRDGDGVLADLDPDRPVVTYCDSGYRADIAASLLKRRGLRDVRNVPGSWQAWTKAGYDVAR